MICPLGWPSGSAKLGRGCGTRSDEVGLGGRKWMASGTPNQDVLLHLIPWDKTSVVPCRSLSEQAVIFDAHPRLGKS